MPRAKLINRVPLAVAAMAVLLCFATSAHAARNLKTGFAEHLYRTGTPDQQADVFNKTVTEGASVARINVIWRNIAPFGSPPADPGNPADPSYNWAELDTAVRQAADHGLDVMFTVYSTPPWAEGPDRPEENGDHPAGTWRPDPAKLADFATALASRYSGTFTPNGETSPLPAVRNYEAWNEQNFWVYISPQYQGNKETGVDIYRGMLNAFYDAIHKVSAKNKVLVGGLGPYGDPPGGRRIRPLTFLRSLMCVTNNLNPTSCPEPAKFDILGVHGINNSNVNPAPTDSALDPNDMTGADIPKAVKILRAAERARTVDDNGHAKIWVTEFWWETVPDGGEPAKPGLQKHARWIEQALYLFWDAGASVAINLQLIDDPFIKSDPTSLQTGFFQIDGTPKPAATSFRFPFVLDRKTKSKVFVWGKSPVQGRLTIEKKAGGGWRKVDALNVKANKVFTTSMTARGKGKYRATVGDETSVAWPLRK